MHTIHVIKNIAKWTLIAMLSYHCFLGIRDSDALTFENRMREGLKFLELNFEEYRKAVVATINKE